MEFILYIVGGALVAIIGTGVIRAIAVKNALFAASAAFIDAVIGLSILLIIRDATSNGWFGILAYAFGIFIGTLLATHFSK